MFERTSLICVVLKESNSNIWARMNANYILLFLVIMRRFFKECMVLIVLAIALTECGSTSKKKEKQKIPIKVYYESLCLSCLEYLTGPLKLAHQIDGFYDMVDIKVYPYGNSQLIKSKDGVKMKCQHGERECFVSLTLI